MYWKFLCRIRLCDSTPSTNEMPTTLELGGADEGAPGPHGDGFYAGYFRDLDGNKLCAFTLG